MSCSDKNCHEGTLKKYCRPQRRSSRRNDGRRNGKTQITTQTQEKTRFLAIQNEVYASPEILKS